MGFDTSFHPLDLSLVKQRLLPYIAGHGADDGIDDLIGRAVEMRKTRFHAKAWALGTHRAVRGTGAEEAFEARLHVWGRPFFIVADGTEQVAEDVQRWLATPADRVADLAREMIRRLDPALVERVEPDRDGRLPDDDALADDLGGALRILRAAAAAVRAGEREVRDPGSGKAYDAAGLLTREVPFNVLVFAAALLPGWMSRGHTWPTRLCRDAGIPAEGFASARPLNVLLKVEFPALDWPAAPDTILANYAVGGLVPPQDVAAARAHLARHREALSRDGLALEVRKIDEAMGVAEHLGVAFCEATEVYSGMAGDLN